MDELDHMFPQVMAVAQPMLQLRLNTAFEKI
jgi:hypothetical protein